MQPVAAVVQHEESEQSLLERARQSVSQAGWTIGECASVWTQRYARGRTDADFAALIGSTQQRVNEARRVHELYGHVYRSTGKLSFTHYCSVLGVDCADDALEWAEDNGATVAEMKAWLRMQNGEDLTVAATAIAPADHDSAESIQRGDKSAPVIGIPADQLDRDRTKEAPVDDEATRASLEHYAKKFRRVTATAREVDKIDGETHSVRYLLADHLDQLAESIRQGERRDKIVGLDDTKDMIRQQLKGRA